MYFKFPKRDYQEENESIPYAWYNQYDDDPHSSVLLPLVTAIVPLFNQFLSTYRTLRLSPQHFAIMSDKDNPPSEVRQHQEQPNTSSGKKRKAGTQESEKRDQKDEEAPKANKIREMMRERAEHPIQLQLYKKIDQLMCGMRE